MTSRRAALPALALAAWALCTAAEEPDLRGVELLDYDCRSDLSRRAVTLFANGTLRLRQGPVGEEAVSLVELTPEDLRGYRRRLAAEDLSETDRRSSSVGGDWVERCSLDLGLPDRPRRRFVLDPYTPLSLALSRVVAVARELGERADEGALSDSRLPAGYAPRPGDVLQRRDGVLYRVMGTTQRGNQGVELQGVEQPLTLYVRVEDLRREFVALVSRR